jgi:mitochondrial fission protein ELM1
MTEWTPSPAPPRMLTARPRKPKPRIWAFLSDHAGDNAQALALAEALGLPFQTKTLRYTWRKRLPRNNSRISLLSIDRASQQRLVPPWPELIIMVGPRSQPVGRYVKRLSGGRTKLVLIGRPRAPADEFDLIFDTRQYLLPDAPNVRLLPLAMSRYRGPVRATEEERAWLDSLPRPHLLLMIGGPVRYWSVSPDHVAAVVSELLARAQQAGGSLIVTGSPRTPPSVLSRVSEELAVAANGRLAPRIARFQTLIDDADELFPPGDSVSMISESVITGKPVGIAPVRRTLWGRIVLGPEGRMAWNPLRDLRRFWAYLRQQRLAGSIDEPIAGNIPNPVVTSAKRVRELLQVSD